MKRKAESLYEKTLFVFGSNRFFGGIIILFTVQALWIALSSRYAMAFDEDFHFGLIKIYADHLSPFWANQPTGADVYGAFYRDPSYLYHYLMSFPYHLISFFTSNQAIQVILLRLMNIGLFGSSLLIFRSVLKKTNASKVVINLTLLCFILIPIVPLLAAQINYDNLLMPITALLMLYTINFVHDIKLHTKFNIRTLFAMFIISGVGCLVKYAFLPLVLGVLLFTAGSAVKNFSSFSQLLSAFKLGFLSLSRNTLGFLIVTSFIVSILLFQRYGLNLVKYHDPVPSCDKVLSVKQCSQYGPWIRDYTLANAQHEQPVPTSPLKYMDEWFYGMWFRSYFAVAGPQQHFQTRGPFIIPAYAGPVMLLAGLLAAMLTLKRIKEQYNAQALLLLAVSTGTYIAVLWFDEYEAYTRTGHPVAINGRYLLPVAVTLILFSIIGFKTLLRKYRYVQVALVGVVLCSSVFGGGALTYVLRSNDSWYWNSEIIRSANHSIQKTLGPITPGYKNTVQFVR